MNDIYIESITSTIEGYFNGTGNLFFKLGLRGRGSRPNSIYCTVLIPYSTCRTAKIKNLDCL